MVSGKRLLLFCVFIYGAILQAHPHKIVILIAPPRSLSTAFLRMMEARKDFLIMNEPSQIAWHLSEGRTYVLANFKGKEQPPKTYAEVKAEIFKRAEESNVFVKEMGTAVCNFLLNDAELVTNPNVYFVFLVRDPHRTILSYYKKIGSIDQLYRPFSFLVGYKSCYRVYTHIKDNGVRTPYIVRAEDLYDNAEPALADLCAYLGIDNKPEALHWQALGKDFTGAKEWSELKDKNGTHIWHGVALESTGFMKQQHQYKVDKHGMPTFEEITNESHRKKCCAAYQENVVYYQQFLQEMN